MTAPIRPLSLITVILALLLCSCAPKISQNGLVSHYAFDGNAEDLMGKNHGKGENVRYESKKGKSKDKVVVLNGVDSYVDLTTPFDYEEITISLWFKVNRFDNAAPYDLIFTSDYAAQKYGLMNLAIKVENGVNNVYFNFSGQLISREIKAGVWYHATLVKKKDQRFEYYFNGLLIGSGRFEKYLSSVRGFPVAQIGTVRTRELGFFDGAVNNLRIYNRALPVEEVKRLANER